MTAAQREPTTGATTSTYNFHDLYRVRVEHRALDDLMRRELGVFLSPDQACDLTIQEGSVPTPSLTLDDRYRYDDSGFVVETPSGRVAVAEGRIAADPRVTGVELLAYWVENLMKETILARGACFLHASAVAREGAAFLFPAWMGTGKTHVLLNALAKGYDFMADDWCFVSDSGDVLGYPRWPTLVYHHFKSYPELRALLAQGPEGKDLRRRLAVSEVEESLRGSNSLARRLRRFLSDRFFVEVHENPTRLFPKTGFVARAPVSYVALLVSSNRANAVIRKATADKLARRMVVAGSFERSLFATHRLAMAYGERPVSIGDTTEKEVELLSRAFRSARCVEVLLPEHPKLEDLDRVLSGDT